MKIRKQCDICKRLFWAKEKPKTKEQEILCQNCRNMLNHLRNITRYGRVTDRELLTKLEEMAKNDKVYIHKEEEE